MWTGLRVSDFLSLPEIKQNEDFITVQPKKTLHSSGIKVVIPLHHHIKEVIEKRGMPRMISDVKFNLYFKDVCKEIGLTKMVKGSLMNPKTKRKEIKMYPKYKLVSSHTCRRSFATNLYKMNFPTLSIMNITGHTTEKSFLTYIKVTPTEHAEKLLKHWKDYYGR
ncbi:MAG: tyrosine-type recombinase/integrase [Kordia sp.]|nr:tyrosine-type recombinase/integrase [Kordia sp.]